MNDKKYFQQYTTLSKRGIIKNTPDFLMKNSTTLYLVKQQFHNSFVYDICSDEYKNLYENREKTYDDVQLQFYKLVLHNHNIDLLKTLGNIDDFVSKNIIIGKS
jgi:hypothetical protein